MAIHIQQGHMSAWAATDAANSIVQYVAWFAMIRSKLTGLVQIMSSTL